MIVVFGSINMDLVVRAPFIARPGETVLAPSYQMLHGGKGANQAVAAARYCGKPGAVAMIGAVGDDALGRSSIDNLARNGVISEHIQLCSEPTGCAFITVDDRGENAIMVASGANARLEAAATPQSFLSEATVLVLQMEVPFSAALSVARAVKQAGGRVVWNFAPAPPVFERAALKELLAVCDAFIVNEHEARDAGCLLGFEDTGPDTVGRGIAKQEKTVCIVTKGSRGAVVTHPDGMQAAFPATKLDAVDTTGAGDTFMGILAAELFEDAGWETAIERACRGASLACMRVGAQTGMPSKADVLQAGGWTR
jgi:ribokinase